MGRFSKSRKGGYKVRLDSAERDVLRSLREQYRDLLLNGDSADPAMRRLFPAAAKDDPTLAAELDELLRGDATTQRLDALEVVERTIDAAVLTEDDVESWLAVCNDLRLVLGVRLEITEESTEQDFSGEAEDSFRLYRFLTMLVGDMVAALSGITQAGLTPAVIKRASREGTGEPDA